MHLGLTSSVILLLSTLALSSAGHLSPALNLARASSIEALHNNATSSYPLGATQIRCNGNIYRRGLGEESCISALEQMDDDEEYLSFGTRGGPVHFQVDLPRRWISSKYQILSGVRRHQLCSLSAI